ncbi:tRNA (adenosine(37)-N6)-threonylcarbamoyltransferase complex ATPase subunit type 1 TsaE [Desulfovibrio cuneatus]|uniref:tRNA (adenosine(37)-N6)-threonylcarbamoyltransferase complex ATPase subunit type 1 TsaE n=1 Tax=Desulfovibrio cuneatus TaxID=159728 RepID=UPI0004192147|nr:tRNA (adenosine(37)-N6)-threonylcarbamoyltransferase complex ATPase subunit type 1 TsaE [Desulfovibrio cuneatus]
MPSLTFSITSLESLAAVAKAMAQAACEVSPGALLLSGGLGAGKTTFTSFFVTSLPGGAAAETSSPSFTLCNIYPTRPEVHHFDLYRLETAQPLDLLAESFDAQGVLTVVEWPERIHKADAPPHGVYCLFSISDTNERVLDLTPLGRQGKTFLDRVAERLPSIL